MKDWRCEIHTQSVSILGRSEWIMRCLEVGIHEHGEYPKFGGCIQIVKRVENLYMNNLTFKRK